MKVKYIILDNSVVLDNDIIDKTHPNFAQVLSAVKAKNFKKAKELVNIPKTLETVSKGAVRVEAGTVYYNNLPVHSNLAFKILDLFSQGYDIKPWANFMEKLYQNPDPFAITQAFEFLERAKLPLTPDGDFLAYKKVREDYKDCYSGKFDNSVGKEVKEDRALCDNNPNNHCSKGLHFCSEGYLNSFGGSRTIIVKVNPKDITSVPNNHNFEKARCCRYLVVGEIDEDYSIEDMRTSAVLPSPRNANEVMAYVDKKKSKSRKPNDIQLRVLLSSAETVRDLAKNLKVTQTDIINNQGKFYQVWAVEGQNLGNYEVYATKLGRHIAHKNGVHNLVAPPDEQ